jgi:hypothetical protein
MQLQAALYRYLQSQHEEMRWDLQEVKENVWRGVEDAAHSDYGRSSACKPVRIKEHCCSASRCSHIARDADNTEVGDDCSRNGWTKQRRRHVTIARMHLCRGTFRASVLALSFSCDQSGCQDLANFLHVALDGKDVSCLQPEKFAQVMTIVCIAIDARTDFNRTVSLCEAQADQGFRDFIQSDG